jgi:hypothetical protein
VIAARTIAGPREDVLARAARCAAIAEDAAWLACYRAAAASMEASLAAASAPARLSVPPTAPTVPTAPTAPIAPIAAPPASPAGDGAGFGKPGPLQVSPLTAPPAAKQPAPESSTDHLTARVLKVTFSTQHYFTLVLDNGQVWQQINGDDDFAVLKRPAQEYEVTISHGFFGSYNLTFTGVAGLFRVRRIA